MKHFSTTTGSVIAGDVKASGKVKGTHFQATADGDSTAKAFGWEADPDLGLHRGGANSMVAGVAANQGLVVQQFSVTLGEGLVNQAGLRETAFITPAALGAGPTHNYAPAGWNANYRGIRQDMTASGVITGLVATSDGNRQRLGNITTTAARTLTLNHEDVNSTAANRFNCPNQANYVLSPGEWVELVYENTAQRWRVLGTA